MRSINHPIATVLLASTLVAGTLLGPGSQTVSITHAAAPEALRVRPDAATRLDTYLSAETRAHRYNGAVLLAAGNTILLSKGYGMADSNQQMHNTAATEFLIPSQFAEFATAAVLQLEDAGKLHEGDHLCTYIPDCPATWAPITLHEVLNGTSGLDNYVWNSTQASINGQSLTLAQVIAYIMHEPLAYSPGKGCCVASMSPTIPIEEYLVERITGKSFGSYLQQHFLKPLGLRHTGYYLHTLNLPGLATGYAAWQQPGSGTVETDDMSIYGGMMYSTVSDLFHWEQALHTGHLLSASSISKIVTPVTPTLALCLAHCPDELIHASLSDGWVAGIFRQQQAVMGWADTIPPGFWSEDRYFPDARVTVIDLQNFALPPDPSQERPLVSTLIIQTDRAIFG